MNQNSFLVYIYQVPFSYFRISFIHQQKYYTIQKFNKDISGITLPDKFTFPFYYDPHPLAIMAVEELQIYLKEQTNFVHDFGLEENKKGISIGKMFGVLVVENEAKEIGYLAAFSGKLSDYSLPEKFVPSLFNKHAEDSFYPQGKKN